ncbi:MAG: 4Fe-4S dicluster domain-containing protein [archaeon]|nr:4Fe-4S dicluster domain-containing protein [archaeon]
MTKWPLTDEYWRGPVRITETEYLLRVNKIKLDTELCTACGQCIKACAKNVLVKPTNPKGIKVSKVQRIPIMPDPQKCVFCGLCMALCPFNAISMECDGQQIKVEDLPISKTGMLPVIQKVKVKRVELSNPDFTSEFWSKITDRIAAKK